LQCLYGAMVIHPRVKCWVETLDRLNVRIGTVVKEFSTLMDNGDHQLARLLWIQNYCSDGINYSTKSIDLVNNSTANFGQHIKQLCGISETATCAGCEANTSSDYFVAGSHWQTVEEHLTMIHQSQPHGESCAKCGGIRMRSFSFTRYPLPLYIISIDYRITVPQTQNITNVLERNLPKRIQILDHPYTLFAAVLLSCLETKEK